ncbi:hypothetical protein [Mucilaginibacter auburnensis]|nr:hypothetical protein [Mucilaginibacter auburnensis]
MSLPEIKAYKLLFALVLIITSFNGYAQKLPVKQEGSLRAPASVKIDGKTSEWNFKAYNIATDVFYTIAHDAENIYLVIKAADESSMRKIISNGITFKVSSSAKKNDTTAATITFPLFNYKNKPAITFTIKSKPVDSIDYFIAANNKQLTANGKFLRTRGFTNVDTLLSVYNTAGITIASAFDKDGNYNYELAISRKLISPFVNANNGIFYTVIVNGIKLDDMPGVTVTRSDNGTITAIDVRKSDFRPGLSEGISVPTDFSGEYVFTK